MGTFRGKKMTKCPKCNVEVPKASKDWNYGVFHVELYKCSCGNQFRNYFHEGKLRFILSAHNKSLPVGRPRKKGT